MNMLIIGKGFDKAHKRPTTYSDFLLFLELMIKVRNCDGNRTDIENYLDTEYSDLCPTVKEYLLSSFDSIQITENGDIRNKTDIIQELYSCLDTNVWYPYFRYIQVNDLATMNQGATI